MRAIKLSDLPSRGVALTAHESVSVIHEVCRLMQEAAQHDRPISAPTLHELFVDETGALIIEPAHPSRPGSDALTRLIDELLPEHIEDLKPGPPGNALALLAGEPSAHRERAVLRALYLRVSAASTPVFEPESPRADDPRAHSPLPIDDAVVWLDMQPDRAPAHEADVPGEPFMAAATPIEPFMVAATPIEPFMAAATPIEQLLAAETPIEPLLAAETPIEPFIAAETPIEPFIAAETAVAPRPPNGWVRRAVVWGVAIDAALGVMVALKLGVIPPLSDLIDRASVRTNAGETLALPPSAASASERQRDEGAVQQVPDASSVTTPNSTATADLDASLGRRGILIRAAAPSTAMPNVIEGADHTSPSPDGRHIAFDLDRDGVRGVFIAHRDGANVTLASGEGRAAAPSWSPDGDHLAFVRAEPDRPMVWNLWMRELSTGTLTRLTDHPSGIVRGASWFPDGRRICYAHQQALVIHDVASRRAQVFRPPVAGLIRAPSVSPNGRLVAFEIEGSGIWMMDLERRSIEQIIEDPATSSLAWRPEADGLTYFSVGAREWRAWRPAPSG